MLAKILLLRFLAAEVEDTTDSPPAPEAPIFGPYTEQTAESYDHDAMSMVWISFKTDEYAKIYYDGEAKKDMQETDATSVSSVYGPRMTKLAGEIETAVNKKYHIVFFDSKEYKDHAVEGLNCKVETETCISVLLPPPAGGDDSDAEENVYTRALPDSKNLSASDESQMKFIVDFVKLVEQGNEEEKNVFKFTPSFDDDGPEEDGKDEDDLGEDSNEEV